MLISNTHSGKTAKPQVRSAIVKVVIMNTPAACQCNCSTLLYSPRRQLQL